MPSYPMKKIYGWKGVLEVKEEATGKQTPSLGRRLMQRYLIDGLSGMAMGLFCTLIVGLILKQIGGLIGDNWVAEYLPMWVRSQIMPLGLASVSGRPQT